MQIYTRINSIVIDYDVQSIRDKQILIAAMHIIQYLVVMQYLLGR